MLSDVAKKSNSGGDQSLAVAITPLDPIVAMGRLIKAIKAADVEAAYDAFCLLSESHADRLDTSGDDDAEDY